METTNSIPTFGTTQTSIKIVFNHPYSEPNNSSSNDRTNFWSRFVYNTDPRREISVTALEGRVKKAFGRELKQNLSRIVTPSHNERDALAASILFSVQSISYGSMDIDLVIEPMNKVAKLFDNNFEYFSIFLSTYAIPSLREAISVPVSGSGFVLDFGYILDELDVQVIPGSGFIKEFQSNQNPVSKPANSLLTASQQKANWLWIVSNTSMIIPTILTAFFLYFTAERLRYREASFDKKSDRLHELEIELIKVLINDKGSIDKGTLSIPITTDAGIANKQNKQLKQ